MADQFSISCRFSFSLFPGPTNETSINEEGMHLFAHRNQISRSEKKIRADISSMTSKEGVCCQKEKLYQKAKEKVQNAP